MKQILKLLKMVPGKVRFIVGILVVAGLVVTVGRILGYGWKEPIIIALVLGVVVVGLVLWLINFLVDAGDRRRGRAFEKRLGAEGDKVPVAKEEAREALRELTEQWKGAVGQLRESGLSIYDLPWYLMIGEPASGKTTTLKQSGLEFPVGGESLSGPGGTRNCDWWFTNEAVILDTAGRFTFQVETAPDRAEWNAFLALLRRHRRSCPINGVVLVIPATSLLEDDIDLQEEKAQNIRRKLLHLQKELEIRFPVFVLITKADRILGFSEFFARLDPSDLRRMFGWSDRGRGDRPWDGKEFSGAFGEIVERVHRLRLRFLSEESRTAETDRFFVFPEELAELERPLSTYLDTIFAVSRFDEPFLFRGFYLTSGLQEGRPIAQACRELLQDQMGGTEAVIEELESVFTKSRAYFIRDFYEKKLFPERGLIVRTAAALKRDRINRWLLRGATVVFLALAVPVLILAHRRLTQDLGGLVDTVCAAESCLVEGERAAICGRSSARRSCDFSDSYKALGELEKSRLALTDSPLWIRWSLLRGAETEVTAELLPKVEAELLRQNILPSVFDSAARRAGEGLWRRSEDLTAFDDYDGFLNAYREVLTLGESTGAAGASELSIHAIVAFLKTTSGRDPSPQGELVDAELALPPAVSDDEVLNLGEVFARAHRYIARSSEGMGKDSRRFSEAFVAYWRVENVGHWYEDLRRSLDGYSQAYEAILDLRPDRYERAEELLSYFAARAESLAGHWDAGRELMAPVWGGEGGEPVAAEAGEALSALPGADSLPPEWKRWERSCEDDWEKLSARSADLVDSMNPCGGIRPGWRRLKREIEMYGRFYERRASGVPYGRDAYHWTEITNQLTPPLRELGQLADPAAYADASSALRATLSNDDSIVAQAHVREIAEYRQDQEILLLGEASPVAVLRSTEVSPDLDGTLRVTTLRVRAEEVAEAALALRVLEPTTDFFATRLSSAASRPESSGIGSYAIPANQQVSWLMGETGSAIRFSDVGERIQAIQEAEFRFLGARAGAAKCGDLSGETMVCPGTAADAQSWNEFRFQISTWEPILKVPGAAAGGATVDQVLSELAALEQENPGIADRFRSVARDLQGRCRAPGVSSALRGAAEALRGCVAGLSADQGQAWIEVANGACGNPSRAFRFFAGLPRSRTVSCLQGVESRGRSLLESSPPTQITAQIDAALGQIPWGRYPFVAAGELGSGLRDSPRQIQVRTADLRSLDVARGALSNLANDPSLAQVLGMPDSGRSLLGASRVDKLSALRAWLDLFASGPPTAEVRLVEMPVSARTVSFGPRSRQSYILEGTPASLELTLDETYLVRVGGHYGPGEPWESDLELIGGPLKVLYFVQARGQRVDPAGTTWRVPIQVPSPDRARLPHSLRPMLEFEFQRPLPAAFPG